MQSWPAYENYTGPLGLQTLTDITGSHYGPNIESSENNGWGQWHRADHEGVGMDRTVATGTGFAGQYSARGGQDLRVRRHHPRRPAPLLPPRALHLQAPRRQNRDPVPLRQPLRGRGTGRAVCRRLDNRSKAASIPHFTQTCLPRLQYQAGHAIVWRDAVTQYFLKLSGIPDEQGRAGHYPNRLEAEDARLTGYKVIDVNPWEDASRGKAVSCGDTSCSAEWTYNGASGRFNIAVEYFDIQGGAAKFALTINGQPASSDATWSGDATLPTSRPHADNSIRHIIHNIALKPGDAIRISGTPEGPDPAALDYIEILAATP